MTEPSPPPAVTWSLLNEALELGHTLDLSDSIYGPAHWQGEFCDHTAPYYVFLAGFARRTGTRTVAELGTHYGGATTALCQGIASDDQGEPGGRVVTVDVTHLNVEGLARYPQLRRLQGDSLDPRIVQGFMDAFDDHVDLLFIDTVHTYRQSWENLAVYANRLKPRWILLDDIHLNQGMEAFWRDAQARGGGRCFDLSELVDRPRAGFGLIEARYPSVWPEAHANERELLRAAWALRRAVATRVPENAKDRARTWIGRARSMVRG